MISVQSAGGQWSFEQLYDTYNTRIFAYLYQMVGNREQADDLAQDTFVKVFRALPKMDGSLKVSAWLYRIATNTALDALRRRRRIAWVSWQEGLLEPISAQSDDPQAAIEKGISEQMRTVLDLMPEQYRTPLLLFSLHGFSCEEIAGIISTTPSAVKMRLYRARLFFRAHYCGEGARALGKGGAPSRKGGAPYAAIGVPSAQGACAHPSGEVASFDDPRGSYAAQLASIITQVPDAPLPEQWGNPREELVAVGRLRGVMVSYEALMRPHLQQTRRRCQELPVVLLVQDTAELDYQEHPEATGSGWQQSLLLPTVLAVEPTSGELLGIAHQEPFLRQPTPREERSGQRLKRERESQVWERAAQNIGAPPDPYGQVWVHVGDRPSDIFTLFVQCRQQQTHFVIRAAQDRCVVEQGREADPALKRHRRKPGDPPQPHLFETVRGWGVRDEQELEMPVGHECRARNVRVAMSYGPLRLLPPDKRKHELPSIDVWVVRVWEQGKPAGVEPLEWVLLCSVPVESVAQAWERVDWYRCCGIAGDYRQALKTGYLIEQRQGQCYEGLRHLLGRLSPTAVRVLHLRTLAHRQPQRSAETVVPGEVVRRAACETGEAAASLTVRQCATGIARLGGYRGSNDDRPWSWKALWLGWLTVQTSQEGGEPAAQTLP